MPQDEDPARTPVPTSGPLGGELAPAPVALHSSDPHAIAAASAAVAEIQAGYLVAMKNPRNDDHALQRVLQACKRYEFAATALYSFPRGSKRVEGPSIDMLRELARAWRNIRHELEVVSMTKDEIAIRAKAIDLETNTGSVVGDRIARRIQRKVDGETKWITAEDERDVRELVFRRGSIALRRALEEVIPSWLVAEAVAAVKTTCAAKVTSGRDEFVRKLVKDFDALGIALPIVEKKFGRMADMAPDTLQDLRAICSSISDGYARASEVFDEVEPEKTEPTGSSLRERAAEARDRMKKGKGDKGAKPEAKTESKPTEKTPEPEPDPVESNKRDPEPTTAADDQRPADVATEGGDGAEPPKKPAPVDDGPPDPFTAGANLDPFETAIDLVVGRLRELVLPAKKGSRAGQLIDWYLQDAKVSKVSLLPETEKRKLCNELQQFVESYGRSGFFDVVASS